MKNSPDTRTDRYEIRIQGILDPTRSEWLGCSHVTYTTAETILTCDIPDQTALHGLLAKLRDMNLKILSVNRIEFEPDKKEKKSKEEEQNQP